MNPIYKAYCRTFQRAFWLAMPFLPYRIPNRIEGVDGVAALLRKKKITSVLLVTDPGIRTMGLTEPMEETLFDEGVDVFVYDKTHANPTTEDVECARKIYLKHDCQAIIGFGGGSSMDCAKAAGARIACPNKSLEQMKGILKVRHSLPLIIAVPTTAGTGSETTLAAVITDAETRHKYPINDFVLIPQYAVMNPEATMSLPPSLTATTGLDALTHAVEAYIGLSTTRETRKEARLAVKLIFRYLVKAYEEPKDWHARHGMLEAAYHAGNAFTRSYVGYVHAVAHSLGGEYNTPHGLANAVLLPYVLKAYGSAIHEKMHELGIAAGVASPDDSHEAGAAAMMNSILDLRKRLGIPETLDGIQKKDIPKLARYAAKEANPLYPVPVLMTAKELEQFYYDVMPRDSKGGQP
ncbi:MAG: iron-containing alcohol dehydrogenase [Clostridiales bacterium]|nr:iron-containing alcohol dehydrogenase [Clostridiales bacterium]